MTMLGEAAVAYRVVLTKADAVSAGALAEHRGRSPARAHAQASAPIRSPVVTSVRAGVGIDELRAGAGRLGG